MLFIRLTMQSASYWEIEVPKKKVTEEMLLAALSDGADYSVQGLAKSFGCSPKTIRDLFIWLIDRGVVIRLNAGPSKVYRRNPDYVEPTPQAGPRIQEFKPLGILDLTTFQRQCEAARNKETGMV